MFPFSSIPDNVNGRYKTTGTNPSAASSASELYSLMQQKQLVDRGEVQPRGIIPPPSASSLLRDNSFGSNHSGKFRNEETVDALLRGLDSRDVERIMLGRATGAGAVTDTAARIDYERLLTSIGSNNSTTSSCGTTGNINRGIGGFSSSSSLCLPPSLLLPPHNRDGYDRRGSNPFAAAAAINGNGSTRIDQLPNLNAASIRSQEQSAVLRELMKREEHQQQKFQMIEHLLLLEQQHKREKQKLEDQRKIEQILSAAFSSRNNQNESQHEQHRLQQLHHQLSLGRTSSLSSTSSKNEIENIIANAANAVTSFDDGTPMTSYFERAEAARSAVAGTATAMVTNMAAADGAAAVAATNTNAANALTGDESYYSYDELNNSSVKNICLGRGQKLQRRPANTFFRATIEKYQGNYDNAIRDDKKLVIKLVFDLFKDEGYNFYKQVIFPELDRGMNGGFDGGSINNGKNWTLVSDTEVIYKIGHSFRSGRKARNKKSKRNRDLKAAKGRAGHQTASLLPFPPSLQKHQQQQQQQQTDGNSDDVDNGITSQSVPRIVNEDSLVVKAAAEAAAPMQQIVCKKDEAAAKDKDGNQAENKVGKTNTPAADSRSVNAPKTLCNLSSEKDICLLGRICDGSISNRSNSPQGIKQDVVEQVQKRRSYVNNRKANVYFGNFVANFKSSFYFSKEKLSIVTMLISNLRNNGYRFFRPLSLSSQDGDIQTSWIEASYEEIYTEIYEILDRNDCNNGKSSSSPSNAAENQEKTNISKDSKNATQGIESILKAAQPAENKRQRDTSPATIQTEASATATSLTTNDGERPIVPLKKRRVNSSSVSLSTSPSKEPRTATAAVIHQHEAQVDNRDLIARVAQELARRENDSSTSSIIGFGPATINGLPAPSTGGEGGAVSVISSSSSTASASISRSSSTEIHDQIQSRMLELLSQQQQNQPPHDYGEDQRLLCMMRNKSSTPTLATEAQWPMPAQALHEQQKEKENLIKYKQERILIGDTIRLRNALSEIMFGKDTTHVSIPKSFSNVTMRLRDLSLKSSNGNLLTEFELLWLKTLRSNQEEDVGTKLQAM